MCKNKLFVDRTHGSPLPPACTARPYRTASIAACPRDQKPASKEQKGWGVGVLTAQKILTTPGSPAGPYLAGGIVPTPRTAPAL